MDSNKVRNLAFGARDALRSEVAARIEAVRAEGSPERLDQSDKVKQLEAAIKDKGLDAVVESSAYTWFNRLCALRFMDAHGYTPVPAVTPRQGATQPAILADAAQGVFDPDYGFTRLVRDRVQSVLAGGSGSGANRTEAAYGELLIAVCDHYAPAMPYLFGEAAASSLAMPQGLLAQDSILRRIVEELDDVTCESVEVLGWLYQFYVAERKDEFFASKRKASPEDIAPATQLFTPNWIVRYLVENSLGRLWMLNNPESALVDKMDYYIAPEGETEDFLRVYSPEELTLCDPACGSGHILVYAFDLLYEIYLEEGYLPQDIPALILQNNLFGMEIDARAAEIAKFALEMKAREKDPAFFDKCIDANVTVLEPVEFDPGELSGAPSLTANTTLREAFAHMKEIGSLYIPASGDLAAVDEAMAGLDKDSVLQANMLEKLQTMKKILEALFRHFHCVVANPPYMGSNKFNAFMSKWVKENYPDESGDLCTCFVTRGTMLANESGMVAMITASSWMFISTFEKMRSKLLNSMTIDSMIQQSTHGFAGVTVPTTMFVLEWGVREAQGSYVRLEDFDRPQWQQPRALEAIQNPDCGWLYRANQQDFKKIPGSPIAYWAGKGMIAAFEQGNPLGSIVEAKQGLATANNNRFLRLWWEVSDASVEYHATSAESAISSAKKWFPYNKGGEFRKWYGNNDYLVNWENDGYEIRNFRDENGKLRSRPQNLEYYFRPSVTWSDITSGAQHFRARLSGSIHDVTGMSFFTDGHASLNYLALCNSSVVARFLKVLAPTLHCQIGDVSNIPIVPMAREGECVSPLTEQNIALSRTDWDSYETSWDFQAHPLVSRRYDNGEAAWGRGVPRAVPHDENSPVGCFPKQDCLSTASPAPTRLSPGCVSDSQPPTGSGSLIADAYECWKQECNTRFHQLKSNEEELNRIFAEIYHMEDEVPIQVPLDKVSVHIVFDGEEDIPAAFKNSKYARTKRDEVKSLVSYGVGCLFGRYSTSSPGLVLADAKQTLADFQEKVPEADFLPDEDAILPVLDGEWFPDDIVAQFAKWLEATYGKDTLEENIRFIEDALGKDLRTYFVKDFYKDHCATYQVTGSGKRPIYWMFSSPKGSFNALVYMHRYTPSTVGQILTKYLREYIEKLNASIGMLDSSDRTPDKRQADRYRAVVKELTGWERDVVYPLANERIDIDLDDGVKVNYNKFPHALAKVPGLSTWK